MTRELKFRVWDTSDNTMEYDFCVINQSSPYLKYMQFTGLKDKNGKEIYEGDIVELDGKISEVVWSDAGFEFTNYDFDQYDWADDAHRMRVIGNIYENPNLLEKGV